MTHDDAQYSRAVDLVIRTQSASVSMLQRSLRIGFSQASDYLDEMQALGIVSAPPSRTVLVKDEVISEAELRRRDRNADARWQHATQPKP